MSSSRHLELARDLRKQSTDAETVLWRHLRGRRCAGFKFRRQHVLDNFILDFYCPSVKLAIEVDGSGHAQKWQAIYDEDRTLALELRGVRVLRFWNHEVLRQTEVVVSDIVRALTSEEGSPDPEERSSSLVPSPRLKSLIAAQSFGRGEG